MRIPPDEMPARVSDFPRGATIVLKPLAGLGAKNTQRVIDETSLHSALNQLLPTAANPAQAEEFIRGEEHTF